ncbi:hypothetical protein E6C27_scaffold128G001110 [Cucumis melo var. makuwa]|uniref:Uncharacterized protein n=1 Tax=Cucumis melo var. makuwa TaxID=1194695 RepID=A0A5A7TCI8_CUCMM|nr:hypothetical protein E6C27_scaffold128G001110 [Cucumis melo var. makuwa]
MRREENPCTREKKREKKGKGNPSRRTSPPPSPASRSTAAARRALDRRPAARSAAVARRAPDHCPAACSAAAAHRTPDCRTTARSAVAARRAPDCRPAARSAAAARRVPAVRLSSLASCRHKISHVASHSLSHAIARRAPVIEACEAQPCHASVTRVAHPYPTRTAAPRLRPASLLRESIAPRQRLPSRPARASRADFIFLVEPIRLSLSRQPAPVLCTWSSSRNFDLRTSLLGKRDLADCVVRRDRQSGMDIDIDSSDSTGSSQPDCLSVSFGYATDQFVLGVPLGHRRSDFVPTGAHVARVRERARAEVRARASWRATRSDCSEP